MPNMDLERHSKSKNGSQSAPRSGPQILVKSGGCPAKYCQVESNVIRELYSIIFISYHIHISAQSAQRSCQVVPSEMAIES